MTGKDVYSLLKTLAYSDKPISLWHRIYEYILFSRVKKKSSDAEMP